MEDDRPTELTEDERLDELFSAPFYDTYLDFARELQEAVIEAGISDDECLRYADSLGKQDFWMAQAFAWLVRGVPGERKMQKISGMIAAAFPNGLPEGGVSYPQIYEEYGKLKKGEA